VTFPNSIIFDYDTIEIDLKNFVSDTIEIIPIIIDTEDIVVTPINFPGPDDLSVIKI
jgi:hypothetical protein